jgi:hypothetical protein
MNNSQELFDKLRAACSPKDDIPPQGFKTRVEWEAEWKTTRSVVMSLITHALKEGLLEKQLLMKGGRRTPFYGPPRKYKSTKPKR